MISGLSGLSGSSGLCGSQCVVIPPAPPEYPLWDFSVATFTYYLAW